MCKSHVCVPLRKSQLNNKTMPQLKKWWSHTLFILNCHKNKSYPTTTHFEAYYYYLILKVMIFIFSIVILLFYCTSNETSVNITIYCMVNFPSNYQILLFYSFVKPLLDFDYYNFPSLRVIENSKTIFFELNYL